MEQLQRKLTLLDLIMIGIGNIIGSGIFILFASILFRSKKHIFWAFLLAAVPNILCVLAYAELASMYKSNDTEYDSIRDAFGDSTARVTIYLLIFFIIFNTSTILLFAGHMLDIEYPKIILIIILIALSLINYLGITVSKNIINTVGFTELLVLIIIALLSLPYWKLNNITSPPPITNHSFLFASFMSLFLYSGYDTIVKMSEESVATASDIPNALILSIIAVTMIYLLLGLTASSSSNMSNIYKSHSPITELFKEFVNSKYAFIITFLGVIIVLNTLFISMISLSRFFYSLSKEGILPAYLQTLDKQFHTPHYAIITIFCILTIILLLFTGEKCAMFTNLFFLLFSIFLMASVIILRIYKPDAIRPFVVPLNIQNIPIPMIAGILICLFYLYVGICNYHEIK